MRLTEWFQREGDGATTRLHKATGKTFAAIARIRDGEAVPDAETAFAIEEATHGEVSVRELLAEALERKKARQSEALDVGRSLADEIETTTDVSPKPRAA